MSNRYLLDACALIAIFKMDAGYEKVYSILKKSSNGEADVYMNKLNLFEVHYGFTKSDGIQYADNLVEKAKEFCIKVIDNISDEVMREASRLKTKHSMSLGDAILVGQASVLKASIVTADHGDFDKVEANENISFTWYN
jgi:PIN domain nuclease of toxin-antitoxin system